MRIHRIPSLPKLAWLLNSTENDSQLWCGNSVETTASAFFEGIWDQPFHDFNFSLSSNVFGSGATRTADGWLIVPPSHPLEASYLLHSSEGHWLASNSLVFLSQYLGDRFSLADVKTDRFIGIVHGIDHSPACIPTACGDLYVLHHHNAILGPHGLTVVPKPIPGGFACFRDYRDYLLNTMKNAATNASAPTRRKNYTFLATISSGYDSTACASIARASGCTDAVTFVNARGGASDNGSVAALALGLECRSVRRSESTPDNRENVAEFLATGMQGEDIIYDTLRDQLDGRIFVTGSHGDTIWDINKAANSVLRRGDVAACSFSEFRINQDFVHLPLPFVAAQNHNDILAISRSPEMVPFSVGGEYDRPIARRIAEEAGVPRNSFGQSKKAISLLIFSDQSLISNSIRAEIEGAIRRKPFPERARYKLRAAAVAAKWIPFKILRRLSMMRNWTTFEHSHPFNQLALDWALKILRPRYTLE